MHHSKLPLTTWFWAAFVMATQPSGISALQLQRELSLGSYKTAWLLCTKLRRAMAAPGRNLLSGPVEVDKTEITCRSKHDRAAGSARSDHGKLLIAGAVEVQDLRLGRIRLSAMPDGSAASLRAFLGSSLVLDATAQTSGGTDNSGGPGVNIGPHASGASDTHNASARVHRIFSDLKVWAFSVYHGLRRRHLQSYLDEFVFRFNRRRNRHAAFPALLGSVAGHQPVTYYTLVSLAAKA